MQPKSQFSLGNLAHKASAPRSQATQFKKLNYSTQVRQPRSQFSSGIQPAEPQQLSFEELNRSTQARQPRSQFSSGIQPTEPQQHSFEELNYSTQTLNSGHAAKKSIRFMQNRAKSTSRGESGEIKNKYSLRKRLHMSEVPSPKKKKKKTTTTTRSKQRYVREIRHQRKEQRVKKVSGPQRGIWFSIIVCGEGLFHLFVARDAEVEVQA